MREFNTIALLEKLIGIYPYIIAVMILLIGFYIVISSHNLIRKVIGFNLIQSSVVIFYVAMSKILHGKPPIYVDDATIYSNPLLHVLMLTAIVVGIATTALACALVVRIYQNYKTIDEVDLGKKLQYEEITTANVLRTTALYTAVVDRGNLHSDNANIFVGQATEQLIVNQDVPVENITEHTISEKRINTETVIGEKLSRKNLSEEKTTKKKLSREELLSAKIAPATSSLEKSKQTNLKQAKAVQKKSTKTKSTGTTQETEE